MRNLISTKQLRYSVAAFIIASSLLIKTVYVYTKNQAWISVVIATIVSYIIISMYGRLVKNHPGISLIEINEAVFGAVIGKAVSVLYVFFFLTLTILNTWDLGGFVRELMLPDTPMNIIYIVFLLVCIYAVRKGAHTMARYGTFMTFIYFAALIFNGLLLLNKTHPEYLLPVFTITLKNYLIGAHLATMLPFCEIIVFLMFAQYMQKPAEIGKAMKSGLLIAAAAVLFIIMRDISVLGNYALFTSMPTFNSIRLIDVGDILTRLEIIYAVMLMMMFFLKVSILLFATVSGFGKLFKIEQYKSFIFIIGALVVVYANSIFQSTFELTKWFNVAATYATFFLFVLPAATLIVSEIKKSAKKEKPAASVQQQ